jgi:hypothetical protein
MQKYRCEGIPTGVSAKLSTRIPKNVSKKGCLVPTKYCDIFEHEIYHHSDPELVCTSRTKTYSECRRCKAVELPEAKKIAVPKPEITKRLVILDVDKDKWMAEVKKIKSEYHIGVGSARDLKAARRIAVLLGEAYLSELKGNQLRLTIVEKDMFDLAVEYRLTCEPLEWEFDKKRDDPKKLSVWGVDRASGLELYTTQLKEWTSVALLVVPEKKEKEVKVDGGTRIERVGRNVDRTGDVGTARVEAQRASLFEGRKRNAVRHVVQEQASLFGGRLDGVVQKEQSRG